MKSLAKSAWAGASVLALDHGEVGKLVKEKKFQLISANLTVLTDILADIEDYICDSRASVG